MSDSPIDRDARGYRVTTPASLPGPRIRADVVDVYIARPAPRSNRIDDAPSGPSLPDLELLQLRRTKAPLLDTWQPVMGHIEAGETAQQAAIREAAEEVGLAIPGPACQGLWALEQVYPFYISQIDCIVMSPRFVALVSRSWEPTLNHEHGAHRWVDARAAGGSFMWPGQLMAIDELRRLLDPSHPAHGHQRLV